MEKELIRTLRINGTTLRVYDLFKRDSYGKNVLSYEFKVGRKVIFSGNDFHCSPSQSIDSLEVAYCILSFLCLKPGDTDKDYFENYTKEQMDWANSSKCEYLSCDVAMWEEKNGVRQKEVEIGNELEQN